MNRRSLTFRLVSWYCGLLFLLGTAFAGYTYTNFDHYIQETTRATLAGRADAIWILTKDHLDDKDTLGALVEQRFAPEIQERFIRISVESGELYRSGPPAERSFDPASVPRPFATGVVGLTRLGTLVIYARQFMSPGGHLVIIESGQSDQTMVAAQGKLMTSLLIGLPLLLMLAAGGGYVLVRRALTPVEAMITAAEALTFNSPHNLLPVAATGDRIDALGRALNRMLERLDGAYQHARRFSADAAHELRTPLSIMRGELELLATKRDLPPDVQGAVGDILEETARLSQIVESLIALSYLDAIAGKRAHHPVELGALARETIDQMRLLAEEKAISMEGPVGPPVFAAGDRDRLKQVLVNLLDNAIKYTPPGGSVTVRVEANARTAVLCVADTGIGIAPEHTSLVFERFHRVATDRGEIGAGLGLAIVRSICTAHGGRVTVTSTPGAGSTFRVELPLASDELAHASKVSPQSRAEPAPQALRPTVTD